MRKKSTLFFTSDTPHFLCFVSTLRTRVRSLRPRGASLMLYSHHSMRSFTPNSRGVQVQVGDTLPTLRPGHRRAATPPPPRLCRRVWPVWCRPGRGGRLEAPQTPPQPAEGALPTRGRPAVGSRRARLSPPSASARRPPPASSRCRRSSGSRAAAALAPRGSEVSGGLPSHLGPADEW